MAILDIMGVQGYGLLKISNEKRVIGVMLTANAMTPDNVVKSYEEGAASFVPKEEMANITTFLIDIFEAEEKGKSLNVNLLYNSAQDVDLAFTNPL